MSIIDKTSNVPLYKQVFNNLVNDIETGVYTTAKALPSERELSTLFGVDRITIRRALDMLSNMGLIVRKPGSGTYVRDLKSAPAETQEPVSNGWRYLCFIMPTDESFSSRINGPFYSKIFSVIESECAKYKFHLIYKVLGPDESLLKFIDTAHISGLIFSSHVDQKTLVEARFCGIPSVIYNYISDEITSVGIDNISGSYGITKYLLELGHRDIAIITGLPSYQTCSERMEGYRKALAEYGLNPEKQIVLEGDWSFESGYQCAKDLMAFHKEHFPSAVFCMNDVMAYAAMKAFTENGLSIPADISVAGFDGIENQFSYAPQLTTVSVDIISIGKMVMRHLINAIDDCDYIVKILIPTQLEIGGSTAPFNSK